MQILQKLILVSLLSFSPVVAQANADVLPPVVSPPQENVKMPMKGTDILPELKINKKTNPERVLFTHYKLSKTQPDIGTFAKLSPRVERAQDIDKSAMTIAEYNRMNNRFNLLDPKQPIIVWTILDLDEYSTLQNILVFDELNEQTFFKYPVYGENIAIVPKDVARFNRISIPKSAADKMFEDLGGNTKIAAEFVLVPEYADRKEPFIHEETEYWLMLAQIAEVRLWTDTSPQNSKLAWYYRNPDYKPKDNDNLGGLYSTE